MLLFHLNELKFRFLYLLLSYILVFFLFFSYSQEICYIFLKSFLIISGINSFIYTSLEDLIYLYIKFSFLFSFMFIYPFCIYNIFKYLSLGWYKNEIYYVKTYIISFFLFIICVYILFFFIIIPLLWKILLTYQVIEKYKLFTFNLELIINNYFNLLFFIFNIHFFIIILILLLILNKINNKNVLLWSKIINSCIFIIIIIILAPPDIMLQLYLFFIFLIIIECYNLILKYLNFFFIFFNEKK